MEHLYAVRGAGGLSGLVGSDVPKGSRYGLAWGGGVIGAQSFYPSGPLWGTELSFTSQTVGRDTVLWRESTGRFDDSTRFNQSFGRFSLGLFLMKSWDAGISIYTGPQVTYMSSCTVDVKGQEHSCVDNYQIFQFDAQIDAMFTVLEPISLDVKLVQTVLPFDKARSRKELHRVVTIGLLYAF